MNKLFCIIFTSSIFLLGCTSMPPKLGIENGQLTQCPNKPNCVNSFSPDKEQYIKPIILTGTLLSVKNELLKTLNTLSNMKIIVNENNYIRAEFRSKVFQFVDDVEFYFPAEKLSGTTIHVRSGARVGHSDFGVNRKRIELIRDKLQSTQTEK